MGYRPIDKLGSDDMGRPIGNPNLVFDAEKIHYRMQKLTSKGKRIELNGGFADESAAAFFATGGDSQSIQAGSYPIFFDSKFSENTTKKLIKYIRVRNTKYHVCIVIGLQ